MFNIGLPVGVSDTKVWGDGDGLLVGVLAAVMAGVDDVPLPLGTEVGPKVEQLPNGKRWGYR